MTDSLGKTDAKSKSADDLRSDWIARLSRLVDDVEIWAKQLGWSTKRVDKKMSDSEIGSYQAPALLMQEATTRIILEPIARSAPGAEGVVDLYLLPAYDDIATVYGHSGKWMIQYPFSEAVEDEADPKPFTHERFDGVLKAMVENAA